VQYSGGGGVDSVSGGALDDLLQGGANNDTLRGNQGIDRLDGQDGADTLLGGAGDDFLFGGDGDTALPSDVGDTLDGGAGADWMEGGAGDDLYVVDNTGDVVSEAASQGNDAVYTSISYTLRANVEVLATATAGAINLYGNELANLIVGNGDVNTLDGAAGVDTLIGGGGNDLYLIDNIGDVIIELAGEGAQDAVYTALSFYQLGANVEVLAVTAASGTYAVGNGANNLLVGAGGADTLDGGAGVDTLIGGAGNDLYFVDDMSDVIIEGVLDGANDAIYTALSYYQLGANVETLSVTGTAGTYAIGNGANNLLVGNAGADTLDGGTGIDTLIGGSGDDLYFVDNIADVIIENAGEGANDVVYSALTFYQLGANVEVLSITTNAGAYAVGNELNNLIVGNSGGDGLEGRLGADVLVGGNGSDAFVYNSAAEGGDAIVDFVSGSDWLQIDASGFGGGLVAGAAVTLISGSNPAASAGAAFLYDTDDGRLFWDADGAGGADPVMIATLSGAPSLSASDIIVGP
jgi:Ca2+-binding RTX toxin-like protein